MNRLIALALISGIFGSPTSEYECVATRIMNGTKGIIRDSFIRLLDNDGIRVTGTPIGTYPKNAFCVWESDFPEGKYVTFKFVRLEMELSNNCDKDRVEIYDIDDEYHRYCGFGDPLPNQLTLSTDKPIWVNLLSNDLYEYGGFELQYTLSDKDPCSAEDGFLRCQNGVCLTSDKKCDNSDDCGDASDELECSGRDEGTSVHPEKCGLTPVVPELGNEEDRIVGGKIAVRGSWPWQVSLHNSYSYPSGHYCGGSLINDQWVLTAGHCVEEVALSQLKVVLGSYDRYAKDEGQVERFAELKCAHKDFNRSLLRNDIGLIKLNAPVTFSETIQPVCLPSAGDFLAPGTTCHVTGWGRTLGSGGHLYLKQVEVPVLNRTYCESLPTPVPVSENTICLGATMGHSSPCFGDSGGPAVSKVGSEWKLFGLVSWGPETCGISQHPYVMTKVESHLEWIWNQIEANNEGKELQCLI